MEAMFILLSFKTNVASFLQALICFIFLLSSSEDVGSNWVQVASLSLSLFMIALCQAALGYEKEIKSATDTPQLAGKEGLYGIFVDALKNPYQCTLCVFGLFLTVLGFIVSALAAFVSSALLFGNWLPFAIVGAEAAVHTILLGCRGQLFRANLVGDHAWGHRLVDAVAFHGVLTFSGIAFAPTIQWLVSGKARDNAYRKRN